VEGRNIVVEQRFGDGKLERLTELAAELVRLKVDVIVTPTDEAIAAVKRQTQTIPIVMTASTDPVGTGFVSSLARPGGNVTGFSSIFPEAQRQEAGTPEGGRPRTLPSGDYVESRRPRRLA
jgi:putative ABC transport system substrate-binding protein